MKRKILFLTIGIFMCSTSAALGFVIGGSNLPLSDYPEFKKYLSYNPTQYEMEEYVRAAKEYIANCDNDIDRIHDVKRETIKKVNQTVDDYNRRQVLGY